ncbi:hypothetical protein [Kinneretia aquatilis]|uniref:hypothetical protein n=1 Tax=Kinneretia aquatilis TaxID=2070761 RepID=UPI0014954084|nr:hypothetical protein [Paucibacter aquatile]WIV96810.1 hypothetical protein K9V56_017495 [Paucibacter aquatile]
MRTHPTHDEEGRLLGFEISSLLGRRFARRIAASVPGARVLASNLRSDVFCEFEVAGETFIIEEPFGDNSRYWIGPAGAGRLAAIQTVHSHFETSRLGFTAVAMGAVICAALVIWPVALYGFRFVAQDKCLDAGGAWVKGACRGAKNGG